MTNIAVGPALTRIEIQPAPGTRISRITALQNDITMALSAPRLRMEAPIPGKNAIGVEIPNKGSTLVVLRDILESKEFKNSVSPVTMALGREASGKIIVADLTRMPHMLIAGATGSGKSVCINDIIVSLIYKSSPQDVRFILVDPKMVEMTMYGSLPHLLIPVVTEPKKAAGAMRWVVKEMTDRYKLFSAQNARNIDRYNEHVEQPQDRLPRVVVIIDELAELMMIAPDEVEDSIRRIAQLGRAAGIHLILATQRPDATVITGLIKANIPSRAAFAVSTVTNSRIILDMGGAEKLLGHGDMLFHPDGSAKPTRLQCAFISDEEVERIVAHFRANAARPSFSDQILDDVSTLEKSGATGGVFGEGKQEDDLLGRGGARGIRARAGQHQHDSAQAPRGIRARIAPHRHHGAKGLCLRLQRQQGARGADQARAAGGALRRRNARSGAARARAGAEPHGQFLPGRRLSSPSCDRVKEYHKPCQPSA